MHRVIMQRILSALIPFNYQVDHIDRCRINNQRANLRLATRSQNQANKGVQVNNTSAYKGVSFNHGKWEVRIRYNGRRIHRRFTCLEEAALIYDAASRLLYADFAGCNFPDLLTPDHIEQLVRGRLGM